MHSTKTRRKFIQLRSEGLSFARISDQLHVSKPTLVKWNHWFDEEIELLTRLEHESRHENVCLAHQADLTRLAKLQDALETELAARKLGEVSTDKLFRIAESLRDQIQTAQERSQLLEEQKPSAPDGLTRAERRLENLNQLRIFRGLPPLDEDGNEIDLDSNAPASSIPAPANSDSDPANKSETSSENSTIS